MRLKWKMTAVGLITLVGLLGCKPRADAQSAASPSETTPAATLPQSVAAVPVYEGPFGLKMGLSVEAVKAIIPSLKENEGDRSLYSSFTVPVPHPDFEYYMFVFSQKSGLCKVVAIGKNITTGDAGTDVKSAFDDIDKAISTKYGKGEKYDFTSERYDSPEFWMLHLLQKNRTLAKFWSTKNGSTLTNDLALISLQAQAENMSTGYLALNYEFQNMPGCSQEDEAEKSKAL